jgi:hypothetical protein
MSHMDEPPIPMHLLNAPRLGQLLAVEVPAAGLGRRAWVSVHPQHDADDQAAQRQGWTRSRPDRVFRIRCTDTRCPAVRSPFR